MKQLFQALAVASLLAILTVPAAGADDQDAELQRKQEEVERLKQELDKAQSDLKKLKLENNRLRQEKPAAAPTRAKVTPATAPPTQAAKPVKPIETLPPLQSGDVVDVDDLVGHYRANPDGAVLRYNKQRFRIRGSVAQFDPKGFRRAYDVLLVSSDPGLRVACGFSYANDEATRSVYTRNRGTELVRSTGGSQGSVMLSLGDEVVIQGRCLGLKQDELVFTDCELVR